MFKLVSKSNLATHKYLLQAYYVQGMALNALWPPVNAEVVRFQEVKTDPSPVLTLLLASCVTEAWCSISLRLSFPLVKGT